MKKQISPTIKAHLIRGAFYLLLLLAVCAIPFALAQSRNRGTSKPSVVKANSASYPTATGLQAPRPALPAAAGAVSAQSEVSVPKVANTVFGHHTGVGKNASVIGNNPLLTYMIDDGTAEDSIGLTAGGTFVACNSFPVTAGNNIITSISIAWGTPAFPDPSLNGLPYTAVLWGDPNGDGSPTDAVVLASGSGVISMEGTNTFITTTIPPTMVTTPNFFVGFLITHVAGQFPAAFDETAPTLSNRSWIDLTSNINDLSGSAPIESFGLVGNWLIRAEGEGGTTPTPTPTAPPCAACGTYNTTTSAASITPGTTDTGNHCDDCTTPIALPFPVCVYGTTYFSALVESNGTLQFTGDTAFFTSGCNPLPNPNYDRTLFPYYDDLRTDAQPDCSVFASGCGVFTSVSGTAPNRVFNIEWRTAYFGRSGTANFEVQLSESSTDVKVVYGATVDSGAEETSGIQSSSSGPATQFSCGDPTLTTGLQVTYSCGAGSPTPTPTASPSCTPGWRIEPSILAARSFASGAVANNAFYVLSGFNGSTPYEAETDFFNGSVWATGAPIPVPHSQSRATSIGNIIYVPGGFNSIQFGGPLDFMQIYNTTTNTWSNGMNLPAARSGGPAVAFNGLVYVIGGYNPVGTGHTDVYIYNPGTNSYTTGAPMPAGQGNMPGVLLNGEIYVVGGGTSPGAQFAYNPTANTWRTIAPLPTSGGTCQAGGGFVVDNELWIVGCLGLPINQQVWIYNPGSNTWRAGPQYSQSHEGGSATSLFNTRGYVAGGGPGGGASTTVESTGPCQTASPTPTATATATPTPTATVPPRPTPTPRPRPTPPPRP